MKISIAQIAVRLEDGTLGVVSLQQERLDVLLPLIEALSEGPIKVVKVPGMSAYPVKEV